MFRQGQRRAELLIHHNQSGLEIAGLGASASRTTRTTAAPGGSCFTPPRGWGSTSAGRSCSTRRSFSRPPTGFRLLRSSRSRALFRESRSTRGCSRFMARTGRRRRRAWTGLLIGAKSEGRGFRSGSFGVLFRGLVSFRWS